MNAPEIMMNPQDLIDVVSAQRNAALDEIVRQGAIIRALQRTIQELTQPPAAEPTKGPEDGQTNQ